MSELKFVQLNAENHEDCENFRALMQLYVHELGEHDGEQLSPEFLQKWIASIIRMQGDSDRHLELCCDGETLIGFLYGKVDHPHHKGFIKPGYGYIMEFFVLPEHRRKGLGRKMYQHLEALFRRDGAQRMHLTADPVTGKPFWTAMGFTSIGENSPENGQEIFEKNIE